MIVDLLQVSVRLCGAASLFAADVIGTAGLDSPAMRSYRVWCAQNDTPPPFGADDPAGLFAAGGWQVAQITSPGAPHANYGRLPQTARWPHTWAHPPRDCPTSTPDGVSGALVTCRATASSQIQ
jgi:hypothetical protein